MFVYDLCMGGCVDATFYYFQLKITSNGQKQQLSKAVKLYCFTLVTFIVIVYLYIYIYKYIEFSK